MQNISEEIARDNSFNIIEILLVDHTYFRNPDTDKAEKIFQLRVFLDTVNKHISAKEKTVYDSLDDMDEVRAIIYEGKVELAVLGRMNEHLIPRLEKMKNLDDVTEAEIKVFAKILKGHLDAEEQVLLPLLQEHLDAGILNEIGFQFMILRNFTPEELEQYPDLRREIYYTPPHSRSNIYQRSGNFIKKVNRYIGSIVTQPSTRVSLL